MSTVLHRPAQQDAALPAPAPARAPRRARPVTLVRSGWRSSVPVWLGWALQAIAVSLVLVAVPQILFPDEVYWAASYFSVVGLTPEPFVFNAVLLFIVGAAAKRRQRGAWAFLMLFEAPTIGVTLWEIAAVLSVSPDVRFDVTADVIAGAVAAGVMALLIVTRGEFSARLEPAAYRSAALVFVAGVAAAVAVGGTLSQLFPGTLTSVQDDWWWAVNSAIGLSPNEIFLDNLAGRPDAGVGLLVTTMSAVSLLVAVLMLLRTASAHRKMGASDELQLRHLLAGSRSEDSLAYFATRRDRSIVFSDDRRSAVSYRLVNGVALASGDPIGPEDCWPAAVDRWITTTRSFGWIPAVLSSTERGARLYKRYGLQSAVLGEEAIVATDRASAARMMEHPELRQANRRARRAGYTTQIRRQGECTDAELAQIAELADVWRDGDVERGFSMALSRIGDRADAHTVIATAHDADNAIAAILILVPWGDDGLSLDVMRRSPAAVNGTTEFLVSSLVSAAPTLSVARISLNFAMFRDVFVRGERAGATRRDRAQRAILLRLSKWWQLDSLRLSNEKYSPHWKPRLVSWPHGVSLGRIALTAAHAEGFLSLPFASFGAEKNTQDPTRPDGFPELVQAIKSTVRTPHAPRRSASSTARMLRGQELRRDGIELYPVAVSRSESVREVRAEHDADDVADPSVIVHLAGRLRARRHHGGMAFFDLVEDHVTIQLIAAAHATVAYRDLLRLQTGDIVAVSGTVVRSASGELSVAVRTWQLASKSLHPLPRFGGLTDPEAVLRQRHIELATNPRAAWMVRARSHATQALRQGLLADGYLEVETPILQNVHGGANARPFRTHINAYDADLSLRIAPELALKKLLVAGFPQVFEIGRNFRNEGADATHNPEFTAVEAYRAFADYTDMRHLAQRLITGMAVAVNGAPEAIGPDGSRIDLSGEWPVVSVCDAISAFVGIRVSPDLDIDVLRELARVYQVGLPAGESAGRIVEALYEELVEKSTTSPTFYTDFPAETSPLTRPHRRDPGLAERWDLVAFGVELGTAYSELVDPVEQRSRLTEQSLRAANRDPEAMELDESFLTALEFGMPPTGGLGLGVDRIIMLLTGATIRQTLAFPFARPEPRL